MHLCKILVLLILALTVSCKKAKKNNQIRRSKVHLLGLIQKPPKTLEKPDGMVWIPGGTFHQGASNDDSLALDREKPAFEVAVNGFYMDITEVTNAQFKAFVDATDYVTTAERPISWEEMKSQLPKGTPKPPDSILKPGSLLFKQPQQAVDNMNNYLQWWEWRIGVNWRHPDSPNDSIKGKENYPVVHVSYEDALAYCKWKGRSLPTEAQWEYAAKGINHNSKYAWGNARDIICDVANTWTGDFPNKNTLEDNFYTAAPVKTFTPNPFGIYDMSGNVWEWTTDWFDISYYKTQSQNKEIPVDPNGSNKSFSPNNPYAKEKVIKGGSFLCNESYCASFRTSARMGNELSSSSNHKGFRTVLNVIEVIASSK